MEGIQRVELEPAEDRIDRHGIEAVIAAGPFLAEIGGLLQQQHEAQRQHQQRQAGGAQQYQSRRQTENRRDHGRDQQAAQRLGPYAVMRQHPDRIGSDPEKRRMAERDDAGIAQHQIERQREQHHHQHLVAEAEMARKHIKEADRENPRNRFPPAQPVSMREAQRGGRTPGLGAAHCPLRPNRPCGRNSRMTMVKA